MRVIHCWPQLSRLTLPAGVRVSSAIVRVEPPILQTQDGDRQLLAASLCKLSQDEAEKIMVI